MKLDVVANDVDKAPKVEDLAGGEGTGCNDDLTGEAHTAFWATSPSLVMRQEALTIVEP